MSVKLSKYIFRKIGGRIVPIRAKLAGKIVDPEIDTAIRKLHNAKIPSKLKIGKGVDFNVVGPFSTPRGTEVLKLPRELKSRTKVAQHLKDYPGIESPAVRSKVLGENLPNYGVPTIPSTTVRISKKKIGLLQEYMPKTLDKVSDHGKRIKEMAIVGREAKGVESMTAGLKLDLHQANLTEHGYLIDTALGKLPTRWQMRQRATKELFEGISNEAKRTDFISTVAVAESSSAKITRTINSLKKKGYRFKKIDNKAYPSWDVVQNEYKLLSPSERIAQAKSSGIKFKKVNGRMVPVRGKK